MKCCRLLSSGCPGRTAPSLRNHGPKRGIDGTDIRVPQKWGHRPGCCSRVMGVSQTLLRAASSGQVPICGSPRGVWAPHRAHNLTPSEAHRGRLKEHPCLGKDPAGKEGAEDGDIMKPEPSRAGFCHPGMGQRHQAKDVINQPETSREDAPTLAAGITLLGAHGFCEPTQPSNDLTPTLWPSGSTQASPSPAPTQLV